jgi:SAM-dependent methyltransferase
MAHQDSETIRRDFDRIALLPDEGWDHNRHYLDWLLRHAPARCQSALDAGCGTGDLARLLAPRCGHVLGLDLSPNMVAEARRRSADVPNVEFAVGDLMTEPLEPGSFDCVASVATLHHLPLAVALERLTGLLRPGGTLLVLDIVDGHRDSLARNVGAAAWAAWLRRRRTGQLQQPAEVLAAWDEHGRTDRYLPFAGVRDTCARVVPGAVVTRHLLWRYSIVWRRS